MTGTTSGQAATFSTTGRSFAIVDTKTGEVEYEMIRTAQRHHAMLADHAEGIKMLAHMVTSAIQEKP
jgi:hypothetical protein